MWFSQFWMRDNQPSESELLNKPSPNGSYGISIANGVIRDATQLPKNTNNYLNKDILTAGVVNEVCPIRGC